MNIYFFTLNVIIIYNFLILFVCLFVKYCRKARSIESNNFDNNYVSLDQYNFNLNN